MKTLYLYANQTNEAAKILKNGGIVAIPTETVYGLAANTFDEKAISKIFAAKGRPADNPLIVHIASIDDIYDVVSEFPKKAQDLAKRFWPGPLTMILPKNPKIPSIVTAGMDSVAVRFPANETAQKIIRETGSSLVAPSANLSGSPSPTKFEHVVSDLDGKVDAIVDAGSCAIGVESTVISFLGDTVRILRPGAVTEENLKKIIKNVEVDTAVYQKLKPGQKVLSPGMKYKHYAPKSDVFMVKGEREKYAEFVNSKKRQEVIALCYQEDIPFLKIPYISYGAEKSPSEQARNLFDALRKIDCDRVKTVYAHFCDFGGMSMAVYNRLIRAAGFKIIEL